MQYSAVAASLCGSVAGAAGQRASPPSAEGGQWMGQ